MTAKPQESWSHPRGPDPIFEFRKIIESLDLHIKNAEYDKTVGGNVEKDFHLLTSDMLKLGEIRNRLSPLLQQKVDKMQEMFDIAMKEGTESGRFFENIAEIRKVILSVHEELLKR
ncbi:MAG: hypothetical protein Tsb0015_05810 [Simkaniaceae bacterium]